MAVPITDSPASLRCCGGRTTAHLEGERSEELGSQELLTAEPEGDDAASTGTWYKATAPSPMTQEEPTGLSVINKQIRSSLSKPQVPRRQEKILHFPS